MADRRELVLEAAKDALEVVSLTWHSEATTKPTGLNVYRHRTRQADADSLPDATVLYGGETSTPMNLSAHDVSERDVQVLVLVRALADSDETGDAALIPVMQWAEIALLSDYTLGGLCANGRLDSIARIQSEEHADTTAEALLTFTFAVHTKWGDPRQVP